jgi:uncharacterized protein
MQLGSSFSVPAGPTTVFEHFLDPATMQSCIPGCEELVRVDETHYRGRLVNTVAHVKFNAAFSAEIVEMEEPKLVRAVLKGEDMRLGSSLKLNATLEVAPSVQGGDTSDVTYAMEMALWGKLGRLGESIIRRRTAEVEKQFVTAFSRACSGEIVAGESVHVSDVAVAEATPELTGTAAPSAAQRAGVVTGAGVGSGALPPPPAPFGEPATAHGPVSADRPLVGRSGQERSGVVARLVAALRRLFRKGSR